MLSLCCEKQSISASEEMVCLELFHLGGFETDPEKSQSSCFLLQNTGRGERRGNLEGEPRPHPRRILYELKGENRGVLHLCSNTVCASRQWDCFLVVRELHLQVYVYRVICQGGERDFSRCHHPLHYDSRLHFLAPIFLCLSQGES